MYYFEASDSGFKQPLNNHLQVVFFNMINALSTRMFYRKVRSRVPRDL